MTVPSAQMTVRHVLMTVAPLMMRHVLTNNVLHVLIVHLQRVNLIVTHRAATLIVMHNHALNNHVVLKMLHIALTQTVHVALLHLRVRVVVMTQHVSLTHASFLRVI
jgi:hypothetical protein